MHEPAADNHVFSASQISTYRDCPRKWFYGSILGIRTESSPSAALGTQIHSELEAWMTKKVVPTTAAAKRLLPFLPLPSEHLLAEHEFRILLPPAPARGFCDLIIRDPSKVKGAFFEDIPSCVDYKSTSNLDYAKTPEDLMTDAQGLLYGCATRLAVAAKVSDVPEVGLHWAYTSTRRAEQRQVTLRQSLRILEDGMGPLIEDMRSALAFAAADVEDVPGEAAACNKYGGCPHKENCSHYRNEGSRRTSESMLDALDRPSAKELTMADTPATAPTNQDLLARLRAASQKKDPVAAPAAETKTEAVPTAEPVKPSPEPTLQPFDTKGTETPPPAPIAVVPPDAAPNLTPETAPQPKGKAAKKSKTEEQSLLELTESLLRDALNKGAFDDATRLCGIRSHLLCP